MTSKFKTQLIKLGTNIKGNHNQSPTNQAISRNTFQKGFTNALSIMRPDNIRPGLSWAPTYGSKANTKKLLKTEYLGNWLSEYFMDDKYFKKCEDEFQSLVGLVMKINGNMESNITKESDKNPVSNNRRLEEFLTSIS